MKNWHAYFKRGDIVKVHLHNHIGAVVGWEYRAIAKDVGHPSSIGIDSYGEGTTYRRRHNVLRVPEKLWPLLRLKHSYLIVEKPAV